MSSQPSSGKERQGTRKTSAPWLALARMGAELTAALVGFTLLGFWIDRHFGTRPWGLLVSVLCGLVGGLYNTLRTSAQALSSSASHRRRGPGSGSPKGPDGRIPKPRIQNRSTETNDPEA